MSSVSVRDMEDAAYEQILKRTLYAVDLAKSAAAAAAEGIASGSSGLLDRVRDFEDELDIVDREINDAVTVAITHTRDDKQARELLGCLKFIIELERIGDLLLNFSNRA